MAKLNQIIAVEKGVKSRVYGELTNINKMVQKPDLFNGLSKTYSKKNEESEDLPSEKKKVQHTVTEVLCQVKTGLSEVINVIARKDWTNSAASADVVVDGVKVIESAPVTFLLYLEKQLVDLRTFFGNLPVLDESEDWSLDHNSGLYKTEPTNTHRTKKVQKACVLYPATAEHPAQTQLITEDILVGYWETVKQSGALPLPQKQKLVDKVEKLLQAVKSAREAANSIEEQKSPDVASAVFGFILS